MAKKSKEEKVEEICLKLREAIESENEFELNEVEEGVKLLKSSVKTMQKVIDSINSKIDLYEEFVERKKRMSTEKTRRRLRDVRRILTSLDLESTPGSHGETTGEDESQVTKVELTTDLCQALSYTVFDTVLFSITQGQAPDFSLISQSVLFELVYPNISRGYSSYLFEDVPVSAIAVIKQGRSILEELREKEDQYLDTEENWAVYAPQIQKWWIDVALPLIFKDRDPDWDKANLPSREEMKRWEEGELSQITNFPTVYDLLELTKSKAVQVADSFDFSPYLLA